MPFIYKINWNKSKQLNDINWFALILNRVIDSHQMMSNSLQKEKKGPSLSFTDSHITKDN